MNSLTYHILDLIYRTLGWLWTACVRWGLPFPTHVHFWHLSCDKGTWWLWEMWGALSNFRPSLYLLLSSADGSIGFIIIIIVNVWVIGFLWVSAGWCLIDIHWVLALCYMRGKCTDWIQTNCWHALVHLVGIFVAIFIFILPRALPIQVLFKILTIFVNTVIDGAVHILLTGCPFRVGASGHLTSESIHTTLAGDFIFNLGSAPLTFASLESFDVEGGPLLSTELFKTERFHLHKYQPWIAIVWK